MAVGLGTIQSNVVIDGEDRDIVLQFTTNFTGCTTGDNGIGAPPIGQLRGQHSSIKNLTFRNFLESLQVIGPNNVVEGNVFLGHRCSDDGLSMTDTTALNTIIRNNRLENYEDKAFQMSFGSGTIEGNIFINALQPIRGDNNNSPASVLLIRSNVMKTTGNRDECDGPRIDGTYHIVFEGNTVQCLRGLRLGGATEAIVRNNLIEGNARQGILIFDNAVVSLSGNTVTNNGLSPGSEPAGGVVVWEYGRADLGRGSLVVNGVTVSSPGGNRLSGNGPADVRNMRPNFTLKAEGNCWDHQVAATILSSDTLGVIDVDPPSSVCSGAPAAPSNLHIS